MANRALVVVHDPATSRRDRIAGALLPALSTRDIKHDVLSFVGGQEPEPALDDYDLVLLLGSKESAYDDTVPWLADELAFMSKALDRGLPVLGMCFGGQLLARLLQGTVQRSGSPEFGFTTVESDDPRLIPSGPWMQFHADAFIPPPGTEIARNESGSQAFAVGKVLGVQFHPEITVDSFDSWTERWVADDELPTSGPGVDELRAEIGRQEQHSSQLCDQLLGTFCARNLGD